MRHAHVLKARHRFFRRIIYSALLMRDFDTITGPLLWRMNCERARLKRLGSVELLNVGTRQIKADLAIQHLSFNIPNGSHPSCFSRKSLVHITPLA